MVNVEGKAELLARLEHLIEEDAKVSLRMAELKKKEHQYIHGNKLEFFGVVDSKRAEEHEKCCKLFKGPNPIQAKLLKAWEEEQYKVYTFCGANRIGKCLTKDTLISTPDGEIAIGELYKRGEPFKVYAWDGEKVVIAHASAPFKKPGMHECYRIETANGKWVEAADHHRILTNGGNYATVEHLLKSFYGLQESSLGASPSVHASGDLNFCGTQSDCRGGYSENHHRCGEQPQIGQDNVRVSFPWSVDAQGRTHSVSDLDVSDCKHTSSPSQIPDRLSTRCDDHPTVARYVEFSGRTCESISRLVSLEYPSHWLSADASGFAPQSVLSVEKVALQWEELSSASHTPFMVGCNSIVSYNPIGAQEVYDFEVERYHNYIAADMVHHNTTAGAVVALSVLFGVWLWNGKRIAFPHQFPRKVRYIGQDWEKHIKAVVEPELKKWWPANRELKTKKNNFGVDSVWIDKKTGSVLELMSNNQDAGLHEGWSGDLIVYDEPPRREIRVANARGLLDRCGRELFCMTLLKEAWVDREVIKARNDDGTPDTSVFNVHGDISVNVGYGITQEGVDQFSKALDESEKDARLKGVPSYMSGLVYPQFKREIHLKKRFKVPTHWIVDIRIDVHPRERQAVLFVATNPRNERYVIHEIWEHGSAEDIAHEILRVISANAYRINTIKVDPLSKGDSNNENTVFDRINDVLIPRGLVCGVACKDKTAGILAVKEHLCGDNGEPSLWIFDDLKRTVYEIEGYMYDKETQKPMDADDHMMENLYRVLVDNPRWSEEREEDEPENRQRRASITGY